MLKYRSVVVPLDGSPFAEHALPWALSIAKRAQATLKVVRVFSPRDYLDVEMVSYYSPEIVQQGKEECAVYLRQVADRIRAVVQDVPVTTTLLDLDGSVSETLAEHASAEGADLVVMTTHGRGGFTRLLLGSVADDLVRATPMPLLLVRPHEAEPKLDAFPEMKDVVVGVDGTKLSERMLESAAGFASVTGSNLTLARVVSPVEVSECGETDPGIEQEVKHLIEQTNECQKRLVERAEIYLEGLAKPLRERGLEVQTRVVVEADPHAALLKLSHASGSGLIALETHGRSGISRWVLGSVADKVIREADVPVLVHRPLVA